MKNQLFNFLENTGPDYRDRYISEILSFSDRDIEEKHDYWTSESCQNDGKMSSKR